jgi:hypothetical protein
LALWQAEAEVCFLQGILILVSVLGLVGALYHLVTTGRDGRVFDGWWELPAVWSVLILAGFVPFCGWFCWWYLLVPAGLYLLSLFQLLVAHPRIKRSALARAARREAQRQAALRAEEKERVQERKERERRRLEGIERLNAKRLKERSRRDVRGMRWCSKCECYRGFKTVERTPADLDELRYDEHCSVCGEYVWPDSEGPA